MQGTLNDETYTRPTNGVHYVVCRFINFHSSQKKYINLKIILFAPVGAYE